MSNNPVKFTRLLTNAMGEYNFTRQGMRNLGDFLRDEMEAQGITIDGLAELCAEYGYDVDRSKIRRLREGVGVEPPTGLIWAIARIGFIKHPNGKPYTLEELLEVGCGETI